MANEHAKPEDLSFDESEIKNASKRRSLAATGEKRRIRFRCTDADTKIADTGTYMIVLTLSPMKDHKDPDSITSPTVRHNLMAPKANPDVEGHEAPNTAGLLHGYYFAVLGEDVIPDYPRKIDGVLHFKGDEIEKADEQACIEEVNALCLKQFSADWKNPRGRVDDAVYAEGFDNKGFYNLRKLSETLADGCTLVPPTEFVQTMDATPKGNGAATNGKNGKHTAAAPAAKVNKKKGR